MTRRSLWANVAIDDVNLRMIDPERVEELRARAVLANARVRRREANLWPTSTVAFAQFGGMMQPSEIHGFHNTRGQVPEALVVRDHGSEWRSQLTLGVIRRG